MNIADLWKYDLRQGKSLHPSQGACLFDAGMWLLYGKIGDDPPCSCPITRNYGIVLNDRMPDHHRQRLKPFILRVVGNRDPANELMRLRFIILETARRIVPLAFDHRWPVMAQRMRALPNDASYRNIGKIMRKANNIAAAAGADTFAAATFATAAGGAGDANSAAWAASIAAAAYAASTAAAATAAAYAASADAAAHAPPPTPPPPPLPL